MPKFTGDLLSTAQVAKMLGVSPNTVRNFVGDGKIVAHRVGKLLKFDPADVEKLTYTIDNSALI